MNSAATSGSAGRTRVFMLGATGTIGRATAAALIERGHELVRFIRPRTGANAALAADTLAGLPAVVIALYGGRYIRPRLSDFWFRILSMALLLFTAAVSILGAIR